MTSIPSTAVPTATAAGARSVPPVSRLIATRMRQKRRRQMVTWLTLVIVVLLSGIIAAVLVGLNHDNVDDELAAATPAQPQVTQPLFRVGPPQWKEVEEMSYTTLRSGPLGLEDHALVATGNQGDFMLVGSVVCSSFDLFPDSRLSLMLIDGDQTIYARTDIALPPMNGQRDFSRQPVSILIPSYLHQRLSNLEWEIIPGKPLNDGVMMNPNRIIRMDSGKDTKLKLIYLNRMSRPIFKLAISIRAVDGHGKTHAHWAGNWQGMIEPGQALELVVPTPLTDAMPDIRDWQVQSAADLATRPVEMPAPKDQQN